MKYIIVYNSIHIDVEGDRYIKSMTGCFDISIQEPSKSDQMTTATDAVVNSRALRIREPGFATALLLV